MFIVNIPDRGTKIKVQASYKYIYIFMRVAGIKALNSTVVHKNN